MVRRFVSFLVLMWLLGFIGFAVFLPQPAGDEKTDAVVVFTGGEGRISRGINVVEQKWAKRLLVSGVDREVRPAEFEAQFKIPPQLMECCITLGFESFDTRGNAKETADWIKQNNIKSIRLITTDWHMRRAVLELNQIKPEGVSVIMDGVYSQPRFKTLFLEYHKLLARWLLKLWDF